MATGERSRSIRSSIDAALDHARTEWSRPTRDGDVVVLTATFDDTCVRVRASAATALVRARELRAAGWSVEFRDLSDRRLPWSERDGFLDASPVVREETGQEPPLVAEDWLPDAREVAIDRLRDTA